MNVIFQPVQFAGNYKIEQKVRNAKQKVKSKKENALFS
jgi:hypothetical protein